MKTIFSGPSVRIGSDDWLGICANVSSRTERRVEQLYPSIKMLWQPEFEFPIYSITDNDSFSIPDKEDIERIEQEYPWVKDSCGHNPIGQIQASFSFLSLCRKQQSWTPHSTTYGLKYDVEDATGIYISEGAFIRAALLAGFTLEQADADGSCKMNMTSDAVHYFMVKVLGHLRRQTERQPKIALAIKVEREPICDK